MAAASERDPVSMAILSLLAADRSEHNPDAKVPTEVLLRGAGLSYAEISVIVDKSEAAARKVVSRATRRSGSGTATAKGVKP